MRNIADKFNDISIYETDDYLRFRDLFTASGLEFNLDDTGERPEGFVSAFACEDQDGRLIAASAITRRKGYFILNDIAVEESRRGRGLGEALLDYTIDKMVSLGAEQIYITARAPKFFEKYGFIYLAKEDVPEIFGCLECKQLGKTCNPEFMKYNIIGE
ncbi:MAG TPA: GNAT family N-acetyltransferase [Bacillota bacterium]|nr:GNAT family N-acetyltransferase [Bacillota bacterium]